MSYRRATHGTWQCPHKPYSEDLLKVKPLECVNEGED